MPRYRYIQTEKTRHGREVFYFRRKDGGRIRLPHIDSPIFAEAYMAALSGSPLPHVRSMPVTKVEDRKQRVERGLRRGIKAARQRSLTRTLPFDLTLGWALERAEAQDFRCALTGIEFYADAEAASFQHPYAPSLDRTIPALGYVQTNVRLVCFSVNMMLADWGAEVFERVANSYRYRRQKESAKSRLIPAGAGFAARTLIITDTCE